MPSQTYEVPLNFKFDPCSEDKDAHRGSKCSFLYANVSFCGSGEPGVEYTLSHGQSYEVCENLTDNCQLESKYLIPKDIIFFQGISRIGYASKRKQPTGWYVHGLYRHEGPLQR